MNKETSTVEITKLTSYDELRDAKRMNIKFFAKEENRIEEDGKNLKLVFEVKVKNLGTEDIGDEVYFWLNESNVIKISTPQIIIENFGEIAPKANDAAPVANNEPVPAQQAPAEIESSVGMPEEVEISKEDLAAEIKELEGEATGEDEIPF